MTSIKINGIEYDKYELSRAFDDGYDAGTCYFIGDESMTSREAIEATDYMEFVDCINGDNVCVAVCEGRIIVVSDMEPPCAVDVTDYIVDWRS